MWEDTWTWEDTWMWEVTWIGGRLWQRNVKKAAKQLTSTESSACLLCLFPKIYLKCSRSLTHCRKPGRHPWCSVTLTQHFESSPMSLIQDVVTCPSSSSSLLSKCPRLWLCSFWAFCHLQALIIQNHRSDPFSPRIESKPRAERKCRFLGPEILLALRWTVWQKKRVRVTFLRTHPKKIV